MTVSKPVLILALICCAAGAAAAVELVPISEGPIVAGQVIEWTVRGFENDEITTDVSQLPVLVIEQDGTRHKRRCFVYRAYRPSTDPADDTLEYAPIAPLELRVRHVFPRAGAASCALRSADERRRLTRVEVTIEAGTHHGPIHLSPHNPRLLAHADGTPFIPIGCNICWAVSPERLRGMRLFLDALAANGGNHFRFWCSSWFTQIEGEANDVYRLDHAWALDQVLRMARERGLYVTLVLDNAHDLREGTGFPYGANTEERIGRFLRVPLDPAYQRRLNYLVARYGHDDTIMAWELFNELDEALIGQPKPADMQDELRVVTEWTDAASEYLASIDQDARLCTVSIASQPWEAIFTAEHIDLLHSHTYIPMGNAAAAQHADGVGLLLGKRAMLADFGKPFRFAETGHHGTNEKNPGNEADRDGILLRHQAWAGLLCGGYGSAMNWWWDTYIEPNELWAIYAPLRTAVDFIDWRDPELVPITPNEGSSLRVIGWRSPSQAMLWPNVRRDTWHQRVIEGTARPVYRGRGPVIKVPRLSPNRDFELLILDMRDGSERTRVNVVSTENGSALVELPVDCGDVVILLRARD